MKPRIASRSAIRPASDPRSPQGGCRSRVLACVRAGGLRPPPGESVTPGVLSAEAGRAATTRSARRCATRRPVSVAGSPPRRSTSWRSRRPGLPWKGHTDLLGAPHRQPRVAMMFWSEPLKVVLATVHVPLAEVPWRSPRDCSTRRSLTRASCRGSASPRRGWRWPGSIPHAGEDGLLGEEDERVLRRRSRRRGRGVDVTDRFPATRCSCGPSRGEFDAVIACYHDQGLIPVKLLAFGHAVNVTLGLPIIRTSVDHGTAFDIAGKGVADPSSMIEAALLAARLASVRHAAG